MSSAFFLKAPVPDKGFLGVSAREIPGQNRWTNAYFINKIKVPPRLEPDMLLGHSGVFIRHHCLGTPGPAILEELFPRSPIPSPGVMVSENINTIGN